MKISFAKKALIKENDKKAAYDFLIHYQGENIHKEAIYKMLDKEKTLTEILEYCTCNNVDVNVQKVLTELLKDAV